MLTIGTSGYQYPHWKGIFYPEELPKRRYLDYYAERFASVEINNTFYNLPSAETFRHWAQAAPPGFRFALKFSRYGSHVKRLKDPDATIGRFLSHAEALGDRLGPILVQLPPHWRPEPERLDAFLAAAPERCRWAIELRDPRWLCEKIYAVLQAHEAALVLHDMIEDHPQRLTATWTYMRYHGDAYGGSYSRQKLAADAKRIRHWLADGVDCYVYFNNDRDGQAVENAAMLREYCSRRNGSPRRRRR